jgi:hypothetical protein
MEIVTSLLLIIVFVLINIGLAKYDAYKIKRHLRIRHAINAIVYLLFIAVFYKWLSITKVFGLLLIRIPIFNTSLNIFRGLPANHISHTTTSIIDQLTNKLVMKIGYFIYHGILLLLSLIFILL